MKKTTNKKSKVFVYLLEEVTIRTYMILFLLVTLLLGCAYYGLTPGGNGLGQDSKILENYNLLTALYFSIVTVSSLGYGDMHPMGWSRLLACFEVIFGLAFIGIIIAKMTSRRLSYHVQRLFITDAQKRLEEFSMDLENLYGRFTDTMKRFGEYFQATPGDRGGKEEGKIITLNKFQKELKLLHNSSSMLEDYIIRETYQDNYFDIIPVESTERLGNSIDSVLLIVTQLIISLSAEAKTQVLNRPSRQKISEIIEIHKRMCEIVNAHTKDKDISECFKRISETCCNVPTSYFSTPTVNDEESKPDQIIEKTNEPKT